MNAPCSEVRRSLLERASDDRADLADHLARCRDCARVADAVDAVDRSRADGVQAYLNHPLPVPHTPPRRSSMSGPLLLVAAVAATLSMALVPSLPTELAGLASRVERRAADQRLVADTAALPDDAMILAGWAARRDELLELWHDAPPADLRERFALAAQLGRAASLAGDLVPPFFERTNGAWANAFFAEARAIDAEAGGTLVATLPDRALATALAGGAREATSVQDLLVWTEGAELVPFNALSPADWATRHAQLWEGYREAGTTLTSTEHARVLVQLGRTARLAAIEDPEVVSAGVPRAWLVLAGLELAQPGLLAATCRDTTILPEVEGLVERMRVGELPVVGPRELIPARTRTGR